MGDNHKHHVCLEIPIPVCVQTLPRTPPVSFHHLGDLASLQALRDFGEEFDVPHDEIDHACSLASGPSDVVVILKRPKTRKSHDYRCPFSEFVNSCRTLWAVDELIRFATNGARSIHTVTVLHAFSFKPNKDSQMPPDERCHQLLAEILRAKKPRVVIRCHSDEDEGSWMKRFEIPHDELKLGRRVIPVGGKHRTVALQSFHPSVAVNYNDCRPEFRCLLIYHFIAAFAELHGGSGESQLYGDAEELRKLCIKTNLSEWNPSVQLIKAFERQYEGRGAPRRVAFDERQKLREKAKRLSTMYDWLGYLAGNSRTFGAFGIAEAAVFLWKNHFRENPLYEQVKTLLLLRGGEQQGWFPTADHKLPVEDELSKLQISSSNFNSPKIFEVNEKAVRCVSDALSTLGEEQKEEETHTLDTFSPAACKEIAQLIDEQNSLICERILISPLTELSGALKSWKVATQCEILAEIIKSEKYFAEELMEKKREDLTRLLGQLSQLVSV